MTQRQHRHYTCSFCGKDQDEVERLIAGPRSVYICNECIRACSAVLADEASALALPAHTHLLTADDPDKDAAGKPIRCSFCDKRRNQAEAMFAGPENAVYICDQCIDLCEGILAEEQSAHIHVNTGPGPRVSTATAKQAAKQATTTVPARRQHLLDLDDWTPDEIRALLEHATYMLRVLAEPGMKLDTLRGQVLVNLFYENSTRTRVSFELAARKLGADVTNVTASASSVTKGESLIDTARTLQALGASIFVVRHSSSGAPDLIARTIHGHVLNAGDGWHAHPSQALLDLFTLETRLGPISGKRIVILGDILHSRVTRSNIWSLTAMGAEVVLCGPPTLLPPAAATLYAQTPVPGSGATRHVSVEPQIERALEGADAVMVLRLQKERQQAGLLPSLREYTAAYGLTLARLALANPEAPVLHPGPMNEGIEIDPAVVQHERAVIVEQVTNGVAIRMAALDLLAGTGTGRGA
jgi:aspartate carbamoyltransferase catalytic subunit